MRVENQIQYRGQLIQQKFLSLALLEAIQDPLVIFDMQGKCMLWNKLMEQHTGYCEEEISSKFVRDLVPEEELPKTAHLRETLLCQGIASSRIRCITKDQRTIPLIVSGALVKDDHGNHMGRCWICRKLSKGASHETPESNGTGLPFDLKQSVGELISKHRAQMNDGFHSALVGSSKAFEEVKRLVELATSVEAPVLITGETGTGKSLIARAIHRGMSSTENSFVPVNCAAVPENLIEAELFGNEKGAFTGATSVRRGLFELADRGTLFLDEIADMPLGLQARLLCVLEDREIRRLGGDRMIPIKARIIAATSVPIKQMLEKKLRRDLYYRICVLRIHIPPLRERPQDIMDLCRYLVGRVACGREVSIPPEEMQKLMAYDWPGNVRELKNALERAVLLQRSKTIRPSLQLGHADETLSTHIVQPTSPEEPQVLLTMREMEKHHIEKTLERFGGNHTKTAIALGISISTLKRKLKSYAKIT